MIYHFIEFMFHGVHNNIIYNVVSKNQFLFSFQNITSVCYNLSKKFIIKTSIHKFYIYRVDTTVGTHNFMCICRDYIYRKYFIFKRLECSGHHLRDHPIKRPIWTGHPIGKSKRMDIYFTSSVQNRLHLKNRTIVSTTIAQYYRMV